MACLIVKIRYSFCVIFVLTGCRPFEWTWDTGRDGLPAETTCPRQEFTSATNDWLSYTAGGCGLTMGGEFTCKDRWNSAELNLAQVATITSDAGLGDDGASWCAVDVNGVARCWLWLVYIGQDGRETEQLEFYLETAPGYLTAEPARGPGVCALTIAGDLHCWWNQVGDDSLVYGAEDFPEPVVIPGPILDFDPIFGWWIVRGDGALVKIDYTNPGAILEEIPGDYRRVASWNETVCGVTGEGRVECFGAYCTQGMCDAPTDTGWVDVTMGWAHVCALHADGRVACWGFDELPSETIEDMTLCGQDIPPEERFVQVDASLFVSCGVREDGYAMCWGNPLGSYPPPGP